MGSIVIFLQHDGAHLAKASLCALGAAQEFAKATKADKCIGVCLGAGAASAAEAALDHGLDQVLWSADSDLEKYVAAPFASALLAAMQQVGSDVLFLAATSTGKDVAPRVAAALDAGQASDIVAVHGDGTLRRPMYAGDVLADVEIATPMKIVTVRASAFAPAAKAGRRGAVAPLQRTASSGAAGEVLGYEGAKGDRPELGDAQIVVSGGRAMQSAENFQKYIFPLADVLHAAVGASRAAVDSGYAPNDWQVGQTGKIVAPALYIAVGISGAIQHLAGMKDSKTIVAINKDADAPIFEVADFGLVADLYQAVPELTEALKKAKA